MESIRIGNDINIEWSIFRNGDPEKLEGKDLRVVMTNGYRKMEVKDLHFRDNVIRFTYLGKDQDYNGVYTLTHQRPMGQGRGAKEAERLQRRPAGHTGLVIRGVL